MNKTAYFLGIDIGTQGARIVLVDAAGDPVGEHQQPFALTAQSREEQSPAEWWATCLRLLTELSAALNAKQADGQGPAIDPRCIKAIAVTSTSGTVIPLDAANQPLHDALMYSDPRSAEVAGNVRQTAQTVHAHGYTGFNASSGLSKMVWFTQAFPEKAARIARWIHAADYITGQLSGRWGITDETNALKSGFDLATRTWPAYLWEQLPIKRSWLPEVVPAGTPIATLEPTLAARLGWSDKIQIVAGMTDGCASQLASGAVSPGDWNTTIGTTMVVKGVTTRQLEDAAGTLYSHRHPQGYWMPGGASNTGADWITKEFSGDGTNGTNGAGRTGLAALDTEAARLIPTGLIAWPLCQTGERFPFIAPQARGFAPPGLSAAQRFAAGMEGVAFLERYAYDVIRRLSGEPIRAIYTAGGGSNSDTWLTIRCNVLDLPIKKMKHGT
ncbi:FGGY-family carbohydrate kinase, partial [Puia sp.]|uniref:FGGY-family carbohydrate kinase n=1 Tax=Puia sp. TaxID=2045100 RepID=UPI002F3EE1B9